MSAPRRTDPLRNASRWGLAMVALAVLGLALAFGMRAPGTSPTTLRLLTRDAGALRAAGAIRVRVAGTDAGRLTAIEPVPGHPGLAQLTAELRDDAPVVRRDATVKIRPRLFLEGNFFLDLAPGTPGAAPLGDQPLPPSATTIHVATDEIFSLFDANGRRDVRAALRGLSGSLDRGGAEGLRRAITALPPALERVAVVSSAARGTRPDDLAGLVRGAARTLRATADRSRDLRRAINAGAGTFDALGDRQLALRRTLTVLDGAVERLPGDLTTIARAVPAARRLLADARPLLRRLPATLERAEPAVRALETSLAGGDVARLSGALRLTAANLAETVAPLADVLRRLRPVSRCVERVAAPALLTPVDDGPLSAGVAPYRELLSAGVGLASAGQAFDGLGQTIRYNLGVGNQLITLDQGTPAEAQTRAERPLLGSRPAPLARRPPLRDDVACETQAPQPLSATAIPFRAAQRRAPIDRAAARDAAARIARAIEGGRR